MRTNDDQAHGVATGRFSTRMIVSLAATVLRLANISPAGSAELFRRAQTLEERVGRVELRRV